ncbi:MAG: DUF2892 domain-containing protein [Haloferacaceae archaeon]
MQRNVGGSDRLVRLVVGSVALVVGAASLGGLVTFAAGAPGVAAGVILVPVGGVLTITALTRTCLLYTVLGIDTYGGATARGEEDVDPDTRAH